MCHSYVIVLLYNWFVAQWNTFLNFPNTKVSGFDEYTVNISLIRTGFSIILCTLQKHAKQAKDAKHAYVMFKLKCVW